MGEQFDQAISLNELFKSTRKCAKGVRWKDHVLRYELHALTRSQKMRDELLSGSYKISPYVSVYITRPKERIALATRFRDRTFQGSMIANGVYDDLTRRNIYDNGACQIGKGIEHAIRRTVRLLQRYYARTGTNRGYVRHLDATKYFPSTPHSEAISVIEMDVRDPEFILHLSNIVESYKDERQDEAIEADQFGARGIGLGSPVSQLLELAIPNEIDHVLKEKMHVDLVRVMDDFLVFAPDKQNIDDAANYVITEMAKRGITVKDKSSPSRRLEDGFTFVQLRFILTETGKVVLKIPTEKLAEERRRLKKLAGLYWSGEITMDSVERHYQSVISSFKRANSAMQIKEMDNLYSNLFRKKPNYKCNRRRPIHGKHCKNSGRTAPGGAQKKRTPDGCTG